MHAEPGTPTETIAHQRLAPFDYDRFPQPARPQRPLMTMPPERLMEQLAQEFVFARISEAVILSYAAENEARTRAMTEANTNAARTLEELQQLYRLSRQEEITAEIIELAGSFMDRTS
uniref:F0F1 ATP synthase subunit gamma n=1 Tax=Agrobacterium tumefaciens TaxID=358 RepID=UPI00068BED3B|nr:F0F1 ATP synthase subunit gamma [Agrobacterium tumefaciens]